MKIKRFSRKSIASLFTIAVFFCSVQSLSYYKQKINNPGTSKVSSPWSTQVVVSLDLTDSCAY